MEKTPRPEKQPHADKQAPEYYPAVVDTTWGTTWGCFAGELSPSTYLLGLHYDNLRTDRRFGRQASSNSYVEIFIHSRSFASLRKS